MDSLNNKPTGITNFLDMMDKLSEKKNKLEQEYMTVDDNLKAQFELIPPFNHKLIPLVTNLVNAAETNNEKLSIIQDTKICKLCIFSRMD